MDGGERGNSGDQTDAIDDTTAATVVDTPHPRVRPPPAAHTATKLGHFHLLEPLGEGGMGTVYSAYDLRLDRKVAIKVLADRDVSPEGDRNRQRLLREAQAMAKLSHPNVVPVYEVGVSEANVFIAMEHVSGQTLGEWLDDGDRPSWREIVDVFADAARGLAAAHEAGIVHRDFKPSNVLVDVNGRVRVFDFGIAKLAGELEGDDTEPTPRIDLDDDQLTPPAPSTPLTAFGSMVGTPAYMSPEQYRLAPVDTRSDQFSFCVALYEALYQTRPFAGRGDVLAENVKQGSVTRPSSKSVPGWVTAVVLRGLAPKPDDRFVTMTELADALAADPARARRRLAVGAIGAASIAAVALFVGWQLKSAKATVCKGAEAHLTDAWDAPTRASLDRAFQATEVPYAGEAVTRVSAILDRYRGDWVSMRTDACRATRVHRDQSEHVLDLRMACLEDRLGELRALTRLLTGRVDRAIVEHAVNAVTALTPLDACADTAALLRPDRQLDPAARAQRRELGDELDQLRASRRVGKVKPTLAPARALLARAKKAGDNQMIAEAYELVGVLEMDAGELAKAEVSLGEAIRRALQLGDVDLLVTASIDLVSTLAEGGISQSREALGVIRLVEAIVGDAHDPALAIRLAAEKANEHLVLARADKALPILDATLEQARRILGADHLQVFSLEKLRASALGHLGKRDEALAAYQSLIETSTRVVGAAHPQTLISRVASCRVMVDGGLLERAAACFAPSIAAALPVMGADQRELLSFRSYYGLTLLRLKRDAEARRVYAAVYDDIPAEAWADKWFVAGDVARALGGIEVEAGEFAAGLEHCERAREVTDPRHAGPNDARCIGDALLGLGESERALAVLEPFAAKIEGVNPRHLGASRQQVGRWRFAYARALWSARRDAAAARKHALVARTELGAGGDRDRLDAWLAGVPR